MKAIDIALKDLLRSFRGVFLISMMFVAPMLLTALIYFAFSGLLQNQGNLTVPVTRVQVANVDQPDKQSGLAGGQLLVDYLQGSGLQTLLQTSVAADEAAARMAVERGQTDVAVIIPANFSAAVQYPGVQAAVTVYHDPAKALAPRIVKTLVGDYLEGLAGAKIAVEVVTHQLEGQGMELASQETQAIALSYVQWIETLGHGPQDASGKTLWHPEHPRARRRRPPRRRPFSARSWPA